MKNCIYLLLLSLLLSSCLGMRKTTERKETRTEESSEVVNTARVRDSVSKTVVNQAIDNEYEIPLQTTDSLVNARIREALRNFKAGARSGGNSTRIVFDEEAMAFKIAALIGPTMDEEVAVSDTSAATTVTDKKVVETSEEKIKKVISVIPWWGWAVLLWLGRKQVLGLFELFWPPLKLTNIYKKIM